jgi:hypothetical protein
MSSVTQTRRFFNTGPSCQCCLSKITNLRYRSLPIGRTDNLRRPRRSHVLHVYSVFHQVSKLLSCFFKTSFKTRLTVVGFARYESIGVCSVLPLDPSLCVDDRDNKNKQSECKERMQHNA